jgi:hypothetical protein
MEQGACNVAVSARNLNLVRPKQLVNKSNKGSLIKRIHDDAAETALQHTLASRPEY